MSSNCAASSSPTGELHGEPIPGDERRAWQRSRSTGIPTKEPTFGLPAVWIVPSAEGSHAEMLQYTVVDAPSVVATHLTEVIKANAWATAGQARYAKRVARSPVNRGQRDAGRRSGAQLLVRSGEVQSVRCNICLRERVCIRDLPDLILEAIGNAAAHRSKEPEAIVERSAPEWRWHGLDLRAISGARQGNCYVITLPHDIEAAPWRRASSAPRMGQVLAHRCRDSSTACSKASPRQSSDAAHAGESAGAPGVRVALQASVAPA